MVMFVTNCYGGGGAMALLLCNRDFLKCMFTCNYIKVELRIQCCLCIYGSSTLLKHCYDLRRQFLNDICVQTSHFVFP